MRYFSEKTRKRIVEQEQEIAYVRCDVCNNKIETTGIGRREENKYFEVCTHHNDWGHDSADSLEYRQICPKCIDKFCFKYLKDVNGSEQIEISTEWFNPHYDNYDKYEDKLVKEDKQGQE